MYPSNKSTALSIGMNIKDWHKTIQGRFSPIGVEDEVFQIFNEIRNKLNVYYKDIIKEEEFYHKIYK